MVSNHCLHFFDLGSDVINLIINVLCDVAATSLTSLVSSRERPWLSILPLSLVSKQLRIECLPFIFQTCRYKLAWHNSIPASAWAYVRWVCRDYTGGFVQSGHICRILVILDLLEYEEHDMGAAEDLWKILPTLTTVHTCIYKSQAGPGPDVIAALTTLPSLSAFEIQGIQAKYFMVPRNPNFSLLRGLHRIVYELDSGAGALDRDTPSRFAVSAAYHLLILLSASHRTLRYLEIPGEIARVRKMAEWSWPELKHLVFKGLAPDGPLLLLLIQMPHLEILDLSVYPWKYDEPFVILSKDTQFPLEAKPLTRSLRKLTYTNPSSHEHIFRYLKALRSVDISKVSPASIQERDRHVTIVEPHIWDSSGTASFLSGRSDMLTELAMSVRCPVGPSFMDFIRRLVLSCPNLQYLEIHRFLPDNEKTTLPCVSLTSSYIGFISFINQ